MKATILILAFLAFSTPSFSQESEVPVKNKHTVYAELFGQGFSGSLNYDLLFNSNRKWKRSFTIGVVAVPRSAGFGDGAYLGVPVSYNWHYGKKRSHLELGIGLTTQFIDSYQFTQNGELSKTLFANMYTYVTPKLGYRFQPYKSGLFFRATLTPHIALVNTNWNTRNGTLTTSNDFFRNVVNLGSPVLPWFGVSVGYTFR